MDGRLVGDHLRGELAIVWVELDGVATLHSADDARVFVTTCRLRTGDDRYTWLNNVFGVLEGSSTRSASAARPAGASSSDFRFFGASRCTRKPGAGIRRMAHPPSALTTGAQRLRTRAGGLAGS
jgi:hypothetical protein